jgi:hypothetical protein
VQLPGFARVKPNQPKKHPKKNSNKLSTKYKKKITKKIPKNVFKKWDPLLDAPIPEQFEFPQSNP